MKTLQLDLGERSYPIHIGQGLLKNSHLLSPHIHGISSLVVSNETVAPLYLEQLHCLLAGYNNSDVILADGEQYKTLDTSNQIFTHMLEQHCDRKTTVLALGGGVVGDITGFASASYQRGVNFIQVPTTLLAMVDSSVGGKTGVNHSLGKNMIGSFHQPQCVLIDTDTLNTLDDRQLSAGMAEVIKYGLIRDTEFLDWLYNNMDGLLKRDPELLIEAIYRSCQHKAEIVAADEKEAGQRALLNLGHTFGHAIETGMGYGKYLHGEAVAIGIGYAADLSRAMGWLSSKEVERIMSLLKSAKLPVVPPEQMKVEQFIDLMAVDKKNVDGKIKLILLKEIGKASLPINVDQALLEKTLKNYAG
jgi:3-dehydroquinate synthase